MMAVGASRDDETNLCCRFCRSHALRVDWAQGDRVCTQCGVVDEEKIVDDRPEWRDYSHINQNEGDDASRYQARSGLAIVDESKYVGGLQPTALSNHVFGVPSKGFSVASSGGNTALMLRKVNRKLDRNMQRTHVRAVEDARILRKIRKRDSMACDQDFEADVRPEIEQLIVQEEEEVHRVRHLLHAGKWSLSRAIRLFGSPHEQHIADDYCTTYGDPDVEAHILDHRLDETMEKNARDLYQAYSTLSRAAHRLGFSPQVTQEAAHWVCRYAARRNGLVIRGVSSSSRALPKYLETSAESSGRINQHSQEPKRVLDAFQEYNKAKQSGALVAAILLYTGRKYNQERSIQQVCESIEPPFIFSTEEKHLVDARGSFINKKSLARAMKEMMKFLPLVVQQCNLIPSTPCLGNQNAQSLQAVSLLSFIDHFLEQLDLPPVAEASTRLLCLYWYRGEHRHTQLAKSIHKQLEQSPPQQPQQRDQQALNQSDVVFPTVCGSIAYFVCFIGTVMQRFASQATRSKKRRLTYTVGLNQGHIYHKEQNAGDSFIAIKALSMASTEAERDNYEMMRAWDAWKEQMPWYKSLAEIERCCGSSQSAIMDHYRRYLYPCRLALVQHLKDSVEENLLLVQGATSLRDTPLATVLLPQIQIAVPFLTSDGVSA